MPAPAPHVPEFQDVGPGHHEVEPEADMEEYDEVNLMAVENPEPDQLDEDYYLKYYSDFLNRLANFKFVALSTVQEISEEYMMNTKKSLENRKRIIRDNLTKMNIGGQDIARILDGVEDDPFLKAQTKLNTEYKRKKYIQENMVYVSPTEIVLNKQEVRNGFKKEIIHYVSVVESFRAILQDVSFNKMMVQKKQVHSDDVKIADLKDGSVFKTNGYFCANPEAYGMILYSDAVELKGSIGAN